MGLLQTIEADLTAGVKWVETEAESVATKAWTDVIKPLFTEVEPQLLVDAGQLLDQVIGVASALGVDILTGTGTGKVFTAFLNLAESAGKIALTQIEPEVLSAILALKALAVSSVNKATTPVPPAA